MMKSKIENTKQTVEGICGLARGIGYRDPCFQLTNSDGSVVGDLLYFFEDNPGACAAVIDWVLSQSCFVTNEDDEDDDEENEEMREE